MPVEALGLLLSIVTSGTEDCDLFRTVRAALAPAHQSMEFRIEVRREQGVWQLTLLEGSTAVLSRQVADSGSCTALTETMASIIDRHLEVLATTGDAPELLDPPEPWHLEIFAGPLVEIGTQDPRVGAVVSLAGATGASRLGTRWGGLLPVSADLTKGDRTVGTLDMWSAFGELEAGLCSGAWCGFLGVGVDGNAVSSSGTFLGRPASTFHFDLRASAWLIWSWDPVQVALGITGRPSVVEFTVEGAPESIQPSVIAGFSSIGIVGNFF